MHRKILVIRPEKLGDLIVATPVFRAFKESFPNQALHLLTDEVFAEAVAHDPHLDKIITIPWKGRLRQQRLCLRSIRSKLSGGSYARAAILYSGWEGWNWLCASLGIPQVAQLGGTKSALLLGHRMILRGKSYQERHIADWYLDVAAKLGAVTWTKEPQIYLNQKEIDDFKSRFPYYASVAANALLLHLGGSPEGENVGIAKFAEWLPVIVNSLSIPVFLTGVKKEEEAWNQFSIPDGHQDLLAKLSVREMMVALSLAGRVMSNSTGVAHLSAALGTPTLGLYTADPSNSISVWGPLGKNVSCISPSLADFEKFKKRKSTTGRVDLGEMIDCNEVIQTLKEMVVFRDARI